MLQLRNVMNMAEVNLVDFRKKSEGKRLLFVTISPNPKVKHSVDRWNMRGKRTKVMIPYGKLTTHEQYIYCLRVITSAYNYSDQTEIFGTWEMNKNCDCHVHFIMYDPNIQTDTELAMFRRDVLNSQLVLMNLAKWTDYMNSIVFVNDSFDERIQYMTKEIHNMNYFPYFCTKPLLY